jgi:hypothetical protein
MTYGRLKVMCAISRVKKPRTLFIFIICPKKAKRSARETPVTISGFVSGMFVTAIVTARVFLLME